MSRSDLPARLDRLPRLILAALAAWSILLAPSATASSAANNCQFILGFQTLHALIPSIVGNCVDEETHAANGDALQTTTNGLLVWRKADNFTAFTDGYRTWVNGPFGLQERLNSARFSWEPDVAPSNIDPRLSVAYQLAAGSQFSSLIQDVVSRKIPVRVASLSNAFGAFVPSQNAVFIDASLLGTDPNDAADVLVHESTHVHDFATQPNFNTTAGCFQTEFRAKSNELSYWRDRFGASGKQPPTDQYETSENAQLNLAETDLQALLAATFNAYRDECGL
jgi:hypothetical protein